MDNDLHSFLPPSTLLLVDRLVPSGQTTPLLEEDALDLVSQLATV